MLFVIVSVLTISSLAATDSNAVYFNTAKTHYMNSQISLTGSSTTKLWGQTAASSYTIVNDDKNSMYVKVTLGTVTSDSYSWTENTFRGEAYAQCSGTSKSGSASYKAYTISYGTKTDSLSLSI